MKSKFVLLVTLMMGCSSPAPFTREHARGFVTVLLGRAKEDLGRVDHRALLANLCRRSEPFCAFNKQQLKNGLEYYQRMMKDPKFHSDRDSWHACRCKERGEQQYICVNRKFNDTLVLSVQDGEVVDIQYDLFESNLYDIMTEMAK